MRADTHFWLADGLRIAEKFFSGQKYRKRRLNVCMCIIQDDGESQIFTFFGDINAHNICSGIVQEYGEPPQISFIVFT